MGKPILVRCRVSQGMFSDEAVVEIKRKDGQLVSFTVPLSKVEFEPEERLLARLLRDTLVQLPTNYHDTIPVAEDVLIPAGS